MSSSSKNDHKRRMGLQEEDLERANEKLRDRSIDTPNTSSTAPLHENEDMNQIPPMAMAKAAGLAFTLMGAAFLNVC